MPPAQPPQRARVCGAASRLPERLVLAALRLAPDPYGEPDERLVERRLSCTREAHADGDHYAPVREVDGPRGGAVWTRWPPGGRPVAVEVIADCPAVTSGTDGREACAEFLGHPGRHTWELEQAPRPCRPGCLSPRNRFP
ncbi:hypothetical protein [Streptomyces sp. 8L]|uniref:hypothetical protein n=1 Tax=Streptomyces sp. 8L TaxID=2877242 RepID=UPI001CD23102|nr:hypothetical protein [Streptomyces sp. 8L]MCA1221727.1 hypothetical protein [Streptomyces sp. 8L]